MYRHLCVWVSFLFFSRLSYWARSRNPALTMFRVLKKSYYKWFIHFLAAFSSFLAFFDLFPRSHARLLIHSLASLLVFASARALVFFGFLLLPTFCFFFFIHFSTLSSSFSVSLRYVRERLGECNAPTMPKRWNMTKRKKTKIMGAYTHREEKKMKYRAEKQQPLLAVTKIK